MNNSHNRCNARGVVMVEFAIILPLLVLLLFGVTEIGRALYQQNTLHRALTVGARYLTHKESIVSLNTDHTCTAQEDTDPNHTPPHFSYSADEAIAKNLIVCGEPNCSTTTGATPILPNLVVGDIDIELLPDAKEYDETNGLYACIIRVSARTQFDALFDNLVPFTALTPPELNAKTEVRYIGY